MESLNTKIDFAVVFSVCNANPNGDPLNGNRPRVTYDGTGELSDVCLKRKIRNRLLERWQTLSKEGKDATGQGIFVQSDDFRVDEHPSLRSRADAELKDFLKDKKRFGEEACKKWIDVRSFGQVFAFKGNGTKKKAKKEDVEQEAGSDGVSIGIRGPVTIHSAFSVAPVNVTSIQITKSVSGEGDGTKKASDTMGMKHRVDHGMYVTYGAINPQLASLTGFSDADSDTIKNVLLHMFDNDASSARPEGSMEVVALVWWKHGSKHGQYSSAKVHRSLHVVATIAEPKTAAEYSITVDKLEGLLPEVFPKDAPVTVK